MARSGAFNIPDRPEELDGGPDVSVSVLDGGPGGSEVAGAPVRDASFRAGSEPGSEPQSSAWVQALCIRWVIICKSTLARSREMRRLAASRERRERLRESSMRAEASSKQRGMSAHIKYFASSDSAALLAFSRSSGGDGDGDGSAGGGGSDSDGDDRWVIVARSGGGGLHGPLSA